MDILNADGRTRKLAAAGDDVFLSRAADDNIFGRKSRREESAAEFFRQHSVRHAYPFGVSRRIGEYARRHIVIKGEKPRFVVCQRSAYHLCGTSIYILQNIIKPLTAAHGKPLYLLGRHSAAAHQLRREFFEECAVAAAKLERRASAVAHGAVALPDIAAHFFDSGSVGYAELVREVAQNSRERTHRFRDSLYALRIVRFPLLRDYIAAVEPFALFFIEADIGQCAYGGGDPDENRAYQNFKYK